MLGINKQAGLYMSPVNWGEVVHYALRTRGSKRFAEGLKATLPVTFPQIDVSDAGMAAEVKFKSKLPYADAFAASLAEKLSATLVTADYDFKVLSSSLQIEFLPQKP